jgi:hypothetical protein
LRASLSFQAQLLEPERLTRRKVESELQELHARNADLASENARLVEQCDMFSLELERMYQIQVDRVVRV